MKTTARLFLLCALLLQSSFLFSQDSTEVELTFESMLKSMNMHFTHPKGYIETKPIENRQMNYEKAFKHPTERFEVRYALRQNDFNFPVQMFEVTVLNISGGQLPEYTQFDTQSVQEEFGANAGATVLVKCGEEFGQEYKFCLLVFIHKKGVGDSYMFYLADDPNIISKLMDPLFHSLKFN